MGTKIGTAYIDVELRGDAIGGEVRKLGGQVEGQMAVAGGSAKKGFMGALKGFGAGIVAGLGIGVVTDAISSTVGAASDLNEEVSKSGIVFGKAGKGVIAWSKSSAQNLGLSQAAALGAAGAYGNMFKTIGIGDKPAADMSKRFVGLAADMASFHNADPSDMLDKLRSGLSGEAEPLRQYGVLLSDATVKQFAYKSGIAEAGTELTEQQKVQARYGLILEQTGKAQGDLARTSDSYANKQRRLSAEMENARAKIGTALLPVMTKLADVLGDHLPGAIKLVEQGFKAAGPYIEEIKTAFSGIGPAISDVMSALKPLLPVVKWIFEGMAEQIKYWAAAFGGVVQMVKGFAQIISGILTGDWAKAWEGAKNVVGGFWTYISNLFMAITTAPRRLAAAAFDGAKALGTAIYDGLAAGVSAIVEAVTGFVTRIPGAVRDFVGAVLSAGAAVGAAIVTGIVNGVRDVVSRARSFVDGLPGMVRAFIGAVTAAGRAVGSAIKDGVVAGITGIGEAVRGFVDNIPAAVRAFVGAVLSAGRAVGDAVKDGVVNGITGIGERVRGFVDSIPGIVRGFVGAAASAAREIGSAIANAIISGIGDIGGRIASKIRSGVTGALSSVPGKVREFLHLASGAYITGPTLAVVGEGRHPEYVLPEPMLNEALTRAAGGGGGGVGEVRVYIGDTELRDIVRVVQREREGSLVRAVQTGRR